MSARLSAAEWATQVDAIRMRARRYQREADGIEAMRDMAPHPKVAEVAVEEALSLRDHAHRLLTLAARLEVLREDAEQHEKVA